MKTKYSYKQIWTISYPILISLIMEQMIGMTDTAFLGRVGEIELGASAIAGVYYLAIFMMAFGFSIGAQILIARRNGEGNYKEIGPIFYQGIYFLLAMAVILFTFSIVFSPYILKNIISSPHIYDAAESYIHWRVYGFFFSFIMVMFRAFFVGTTQTKTLTLNSIVMVLSNVVFNYILIFGRFGAPEMGIRGAAIGTFAARILELGIVLFYVWKKDTKVKLFDEKFRDGIIGKGSGTVWKTFFKVCIPILTSDLLWAVSLPMQTAILGHLSADAIAANSVSSTFFQYLKVIVIAIAGASAVVIGKDIGSNDEEKVRCNGRTLSVLYLAIGLLLGTVLFLLRSPLLSMYRLTPQATLYADHFMIIMSVIMVGMSYQMPVGVGIIQGGGDTKFSMYLNLISVWCIVMPLSFLAAFYWKLPVELVVIAVQSDQIFKCLPIFLRFKSYKWIHKLTAID